MKKKNTSKKLVLLDAHAILHRAYHALPDFSTAKGEPTGALYGLSSMILKIIDDLEPDYVIACYDLPGPTYRHEAYDGYKAQRKKADDDLVLQMKRSHDVFSAFAIPEYSHPGFEADDILGTIVEKLSTEKDIEIVIASGDMDTMQLVDKDKVSVYTLKKGINDTILYNQKKVEERFGFSPKQLPDFKGLRGDPSDNIIGIKGIGEKTATTLITAFGTIENMYRELKKHPEKGKEIGLSERILALILENEEEAIFSKMLATIRRDAPIDFSVPSKTWRESFEIDKADALFQELEFRTFSARLHTVLSKGREGSRQDKGSQLSLNTLSNAEIDTDEVREVALALWILNSNIVDPTLDDILRFSHTKDFTKARDNILGEIKRQKLEFVYETIEKPLIPIVKKMETLGVRIDKKYLAQLSKEYHTKLSLLEREIWDLAGREFNIASPKQLGEVLFNDLGLVLKNQKKTSTGMKSTKESELEKMKDLHPIIQKVLEYREFAKLLSTYIDAIPKLIDEKGRLHTKLRQAGTTTGRMSSIDPNLQNIPIKTELGRNIRKAFIAEEGFTLASLDYSQIELRVAAIMSQDPIFLEIFRTEQDVHMAVASEVFKIPPERVDKGMRAKAKTINFGVLYGMGVNALRQNLQGTREEAATFYAEYFKRFSGLAEYLERVKKDAVKKGFTETLFGRRRYLEGLSSRIPYIKAAAERMAINAPIQGTAADILKLAMGEISRWIQKENIEEDVRMILQIHDELLFEIKSGKEYEMGMKIKEIMESVLPGDKSFGVICRVNVATGSSWGELKEL